MSVNSGLKTTKIIGQRKAFYRHRIPESSCARKESVDINILVTSRTVDRRIMQSFRITSMLPSRINKWNQLSLFRWTSIKVIPIKATFWQWVKVSREAASEGATVLHIRFRSLSSNSKKQLGAPVQTWQ